MQDSAIATKYTLSQKEQAIYNQFLKRQPSQQSQSSQQSQQSQQPSQKEQKVQMMLPVSQQQTDVFAQEIQQMIKTEQQNKNVTNQQSKLIEQQMQMMKDNQVALFQMMKQLMEGNKDWEQLKNNQQKQVVDSLQPIMTQLQEFKNGYQQAIELSSQVKSQVDNLSKQVNNKEQKFQLQQEVISQLANLSNNKTTMNSLVQEICSTLQAISFNALNNQQTSSETTYNTTQGINFLQNQIKQVQRETEQIEKDLFSRYKKIQEELIQLKKQNQEELQGILGVNFKQKLDNFDYADLINDLDLIRKERNKIVQTYNSTYVQYPSYFKKQKPAISDSKTKGKKQQAGKKKEDEQKALQEMMYFKDKQKYRPQQQAFYVENRYIIEAPPPPKKVKVYTNVQKLSEDQMQDSELQPRVPVQPSQLASLPENLTQQQFNELKNMINLGNQKIYVRDQETQIQQDTELYDQNKMLFEEQKKNGPSAVYIQQELQNQKKEENKFPQVSQLKPKVQYKHPDIKNIVPKMIQIEDINQFPFDIQQAALEADQQVQQKLGQDKEQEMSKKAVDLALDLILQKLSFKEIPQQKPQQTADLGK